MTTETPNFGMLLAPVLGRVDAAARPRFLALLERTAADRYRRWAELLPDDAGVLLSCAASEDEISDRIESVFPINDDKLAELVALLPEARTLYFNAFDGIPVDEQLRMQSDAELQGAHAWRSIAASVTDPLALRELAKCSELEEESSRVVKQLLASRVSSA